MAGQVDIERAKRKKNKKVLDTKCILLYILKRILLMLHINIKNFKEVIKFKTFDLLQFLKTKLKGEKNEKADFECYCIFYSFYVCVCTNACSNYCLDSAS